MPEPSDGEYVSDPDEIVPCFCGEPKREADPCLNPDCFAFGGVRRFITLTFAVVAMDDEHIPTPDTLRTVVEAELERRWMTVGDGQLIPEGGWVMESIGYADNDEDKAVAGTPHEQVVADYRRSDGEPIIVDCGTYYAGEKQLCTACEKAMEARYPQGWRYYPGDVCKHGQYTGGSGADLMCQACENGD